ncbi:hypothetical protein CA85_52790 [Allorhodopirellula solitaria]|uniref:Uncharacterized protein n=1 Tax=Allorhodopirellula solitaria TaxID=2527987 RepID=A0A5C5WHL5_9BACT|nr:hypothetical protein CA85_52790 [Allorhodopirellula solitaria]
MIEPLYLVGIMAVMPRVSNFGSSRNLVARIFRHQIEFAAVKQNPESVVGEGTKASCG